MTIWQLDPADLPPPLTEEESAERLARARAAIARIAVNPPPPNKPSQIHSYNPETVRVFFNGIELRSCCATVRYSPWRERRRVMRAARRARKLRRGWA